MSSDKTLEYIQKDLRQRQGCEIIILYGSRSRGEETATSDYDVLGLRPGGEPFRDTRIWNGAYLDIFIYPESTAEKVDASMLYMRGGKVLLDKNNIGKKFLADIDSLFNAGPKALRPDEISALALWAEKSLARIKGGGIDGNFRRVEFIPAVLEHYFNMRGMWYLGPKASLRFLKEKEPSLYLAFEKALEVGAPTSAIEDLVLKLKN